MPVLCPPFSRHSPCVYTYWGRFRTPIYPLGPYTHWGFHFDVNAIRRHECMCECVHTTLVYVWRVNDSTILYICPDFFFFKWLMKIHWHCFSRIISLISPRHRFRRQSHHGPFTRVPGIQTSMPRRGYGPNNQPTLPRTPAGLGNRLNPLLDSASIFMAKALTPSTLKAYSYAWSPFNLFSISMHGSVFPVSAPIVSAFIVHCSESRRHKWSTIHETWLVFNFI